MITGRLGRPKNPVRQTARDEVRPKSDTTYGTQRATAFQEIEKEEASARPYKELWLRADMAAAEFRAEATQARRIEERQRLEAVKHKAAFVDLEERVNLKTGGAPPLPPSILPPESRCFEPLREAPDVHPCGKPGAPL